MFKYQIITNPNFLIDEEIIKNIFLEVDNIIDKKQNGILNIVFVTLDEIQKLNKDYRQKDYATDVLSFHYFLDFLLVKDDEIAGELIFAEEKIISQGIEYGLGTQKEFYKLLIHSILHILGFDHEIDSDYEIMQNYENVIWNKIFDKN
ncbi:rRNA maturation RNase YbeY [Candidatus Gracilibacteria bacterium]|nr:rRNA maturation RNase YbeY [Candidatus Gracilibacteria bacterium]